MWRGGRDDNALWQDQPPSKPFRVSSAWRGQRDEERRIEEEHRREDKGNQSQNRPAGYHRGGGGRDQRRKPTRNGKAAQPTVPRGGEVPSRKRIAVKNKTTCITKKRRQNIQSCATAWVARLPWPLLSSALRKASAGRQKKNEHGKPTVPCLSLAARLPRPWPSTE